MLVSPRQIKVNWCLPEHLTELSVLMEASCETCLQYVALIGGAIMCLYIINSCLEQKYLFAQITFPPVKSNFSLFVQLFPAVCFLMHLIHIWWNRNYHCSERERRLASTEMLTHPDRVTSPNKLGTVLLVAAADTALRTREAWCLQAALVWSHSDVRPMMRHCSSWVSTSLSTFTGSLQSWRRTWRQEV